jgi:outer membrane protein with beta-barrel domain
MKRTLTLGIILCVTLSSFAQVDTTGKENPSEKSDTIKVGGMIIIRKPGGEHDIYKKDKEGGTYHYHHHDYNRPANISTNWCIFDFGFSLYADNTDYKSPETQTFAPGTNKDAFRLNTWKSRNINLWLFMQKLNVVQHVVNLKYGFGLELNNYYYTDNRLHFEKNQAYVVKLDSAYESLDKNKLAVDYLTIPLMINFNFTPDRGRGFGVSAGVSAGLRYSSRQKIKNNGDVDKLHDDFGLRTWKISYIGEILLGPVKLYGSYATQSMWENGLDQTPYTVGIRLSNW